MVLMIHVIQLMYINVRNTNDINSVKGCTNALM